MTETTRSDATETETPTTQPSPPITDAPEGAAAAPPAPEPASAEPADTSNDGEADNDAEEAPEEPLPETFKELGVPPSILSALEKMGWTKPTPVQCKAYDPLVEGEDLLVQSHTGSGKTGAFCLPCAKGSINIP